MTTGMARRFELRILLWSWGLHIDLIARAVVGDNRDAVRIGSRSAVRPVAPIDQSDLDWLLRGFSRVAHQIDQAIAAGSEMVIEVLGLDYPLTDYQDDAIALTAAVWAAEEFGFDAPEVDVQFDQGRNRYVIDYR